MTVKMIVRAAVLENTPVKAHTSAKNARLGSTRRRMRREMSQQPVPFVPAELIQSLLQKLAQIVLLENSSLMTEDRQLSMIASSVAGLAVLASILGQDRRHAMAAMLERTW